MSTITYGSTALGFTDGFTLDAERHLRLVTMPATDVKPVRLTRRGRVVVVLVALAALIVGALMFGDSTAATSEAAPIGTESITVQPGQTVWEIAAEANPGGDIRDTVDRIILLNALEKGAALQAGDELAVPVYE